MIFTEAAHSYMPPVMLSSFSPEALGRRVNNTVPASATWSATNRIVYVPFSLNRPVVVYKLWWLNGATVGTNNFRVAVYGSAFNRLILGTSTLSAGANACQYDDITDTALPAGRYYMALWGSGTTATIFRAATSAAMGIYYETNASGPASTGTPASPGATNPALPMFGLQLRSSP